MSELLANVLKKIRGPLCFGSRENFQFVLFLKDLEPTLEGYLLELEQLLRQEPLADKSLVQCYEDFIVKVRREMAGFDVKTREGKIAVLVNLLNCLEDLKNPKKGPSPEPLRRMLDVTSLREGQAGLSSPITSISGVGTKIAALFHKKGIHTVEDLLYFLPRAYEDRRFIQTIEEAIPGSRATLVASVVAAGRKFYGRRPVLEVLFNDGTGTLAAKWFHGNDRYLLKLFRPKARFILTGNINVFYRNKEMIHPDFELIGDERDEQIHFLRIVPVYSETEGLFQKTIRRIMYRALHEFADYCYSPLSLVLTGKRSLMDIREAIRFVHFPPDDYDLSLCNQAASVAHHRLIYDEFFFFNLGLAVKKAGLKIERGPVFPLAGPSLHGFLNLLPFVLTDAQKRVIEEISRDLQSGQVMNRLLQGDVGCGKTVVATAAMFAACDGGYQAALMAPTEILADQHYGNIVAWCEKVGLKAVLLTGRLKNSARSRIIEGIAGGEDRIIIGTHALLEKDVVFHRLGLIVIDEQHRFGVEQRAILRKKGDNPHVLVMSATPIPRTLAMTIYGDLDVSIIDELPPTKKKIQTMVLTEDKRSLAYQIIEKEVLKKNQVFIVYPLVEESGTLELKDATNMAKYLQGEIFPRFSVGLIHGRMKAQDKEQVMSLFQSRKIDILVSTTVIEVGIDVPDASVMLVEHAERFGLSQLHQLRGRVGRGGHNAICLLMTRESPTADAVRRLKKMAETDNGFEIAEADLAIRGPGEFLGTRQSGLPDFRIGNILRDSKILAEAREDAFFLSKTDPGLEKPEHETVREILFLKWRDKLEMIKTS